ncbi:glycosyltransferase family 39 protein [Candidatus Sumerlaeota bacterium]|nr:glycosyltransferase family 39 protein [Candidatus Sumerlaeota bacterium]
MDDPTPPIRPFVPGQPSPKDKTSGEKTASSPRRPALKPLAGSPERPAVEPGAGHPGLSPSRFATPEPTPRSSMMEKAVVPEVAEEEEDNEEALIRPAEQVSVRRREFKGDRFEPFFIFLLFVLSALTIILTSENVGMCWDEAYYVEAARRTIAWTNLVARDGLAAVSTASLQDYWDAYDAEPRGHPSVTRFLVALGMAFSSPDESPLHAMRIPIAACFGLTLVLIYLLARHCFGRVTAWISVMAYFFMPRIFGQAHFAVTDTPTTLMTVAVVYAFVLGLESLSWAVATGILFGIALATKINAAMLLPVLLPWAFVYHRERSLRNVYSLLFLAPVSMVAVWPWMWRNGVQNFLKYLVWNASHSPTGTYYMGAAYNYNSPLGPVPCHYTLAMIAMTVPVLTLLLFVFGLARTVRSPRRYHFAVLFLWAAVAPCLALTLGLAPTYDGIRLFLPAFPFIAILAGIGGAVWVRVAAFFDRGIRRLSFGGIVLSIITVLIALDGGWGMLKVNPYYLSYYNALSGGPKGAMRKGMEVAYWCEALNRKALDRINGIVRDGESLMPLAMNEDILRYYRQWGWLKPGIRLVPAGRGPADYHLLQYRFGLFQRPEWTLYRDYTPLAAFGLPDVPMMALYRTGREFETRWPTRSPG